MRKFILTYNGDSQAVVGRLIAALMTQYTSKEVTLFEETETELRAVPVPEHPLEMVLRDLEAELAENNGIIARQYQDRIKSLRAKYER